MGLATHRGQETAPTVAEKSLNPLRVACVGTSGWAEVIAQAVIRSDQLHLVSCYSRSAARRDAFASRYRCESRASYEHLLADKRVEAILLCTPNPVHEEQITQAATAGKHIWVEKPIAHTLASAQRIRATVEQTGVTFAVGHNARFLGASRAMKSQVQDGNIGQVVLVEANYSNESAQRLTPDHWRYFVDQAPGGPLIQLLVHHFDTVQYILGAITEVQAYKRRLYTSAEVDDVAVVIAQFAGGYLGYFGSSWTSPLAYSIHLYGTEANLFHEVDMAYWKTPHVDGQSTLLRQARGSSERIALEIPKRDMFRDELEDFAAAVRVGHNPQVGFAEAIQALAAVEAALCSAQSNRPVTLAEVLEGSNHSSVAEL